MKSVRKAILCYKRRRLLKVQVPDLYKLMDLCHSVPIQHLVVWAFLCKLIFQKHNSSNLHLS